MAPQWDNGDGHVQPSCEQCHRLTDCATIHNDAVPNCPFELCQACTEFAELNKKIASVHAQLASLVRQRQAVKSRINFQYDQLTGRLPVEIICEIFVLAADNSSYNIWSPKGSIRPPLLLGIVCKRWRDITLALPRLWSTLNIAYRDSDAKNGVSLPEEWLHRAIREPLRVEYHGGCCWNASTYRSTMRLANVLRSHADRWKHLSFSGIWKQFHGLFNNLDEVSQLDTLSIVINYQWQTEGFREPIRLKKPIAPINLTVHNVALHRIPLQWTNLTHLDVDYLQLDEFFHIIRHASKLINCFIHSILDTGEEASYSLPTTPIVHPLVTAIKFQHSSAVHPLRYLSFPSLKTSNVSIPLNHSNISDLSCFGTLVDFFDRSGLATLDTCLFSLLLVSVPIPVPCFQFLPWITHLEIRISNAYEFSNIESFFRALTKTSDPPFLPHLQVLRLIVDKISRSGCMALCDALRVHTNRDEVFDKGFEESNSDARMLGAEQISPQFPHTEGHCARPLSVVHIEYSCWGHSGCIDADIIAVIMDIIASGFRVEIVDSYQDNMLVAMTRHIINRELPFSEELE